MAPIRPYIDKRTEERLRELAAHYGLSPSAVLRMVIKTAHDKIFSKKEETKE